MVRAIAFVLTLLAVGASVAAAAPAAAAEQPCWKRVLDDWSNDERIEGNYSARCLQEALRRVPEDIRAYSNFEEEVRLARQNGGGRFLQGAGGGGEGGAEGSTATGVQEVEPNVDRNADGPIASVLRSGGTNDADSIPLPLLILAALALLLMTAGGAGLVQRKLRGRASRS